MPLLDGDLLSRLSDLPAMVPSNLSTSLQIVALESAPRARRSSSVCHSDRADSGISDNQGLSACESARPGVHIGNLSVSLANRGFPAGGSGELASSVLIPDGISSRSVPFREHTVWHTPLVVKSFIRWIMLAFRMAIILFQPTLSGAGDSHSRLTPAFSGAA
jgi:hypothetical protein